MTVSLAIKKGQMIVEREANLHRETSCGAKAETGGFLFIDFWPAASLSSG